MMEGVEWEPEIAPVALALAVDHEMVVNDCYRRPSGQEGGFTAYFPMTAVHVWHGNGDTTNTLRARVMQRTDILQRHSIWRHTRPITWYRDGNVTFGFSGALGVINKFLEFTHYLDQLETAALAAVRRTVLLLMALLRRRDARLPLGQRISRPIIESIARRVRVLERQRAEVQLRAGCVPAEWDAESESGHEK